MSGLIHTHTHTRVYHLISLCFIGVPFVREVEWVDVFHRKEWFEMKLGGMRILLSVVFV